MNAPLTVDPAAGRADAPTGSTRSALVDGVDVDALTAAITACPAVARLDAGTPVQRVASYLPGRQVDGIAVSTDAVSVQVALNWESQVGDLADQVEAAVRGLIGRRSLQIRVSDVVVPGEEADPGTLVDTAKDAAGDLAEKAKDKAEEAGDKVQELADTAKDKTEDLAEQAGDKAEDLADKAQDKAEDVADSAEDPAHGSGSGDTTLGPGTVITLPVTAEVVITKLVVQTPEPADAPASDEATTTGQDDGSAPHGQDTVDR